MEVEKVFKMWWKLMCYICSQCMGVCIQCFNKNCYQVFYVICVWCCRLFFKMKNSQGVFVVLDSMLLKVYCDKYCFQDYVKENVVVEVIKDVKCFYKWIMKGCIWVNS